MDAAVSVTTVRKKHRRIGAGTVVIYLVLIFWAVLTIFPFVWVVLNSFKPSGGSAPFLLLTSGDVHLDELSDGV